MIVSLPGGRSMSMSLEEYLSLEDSDFQNFQAFEQGFFISNPHCDSAMIDLIGQKVEIEDHDEYEDNSLYSPDDLDELLSSDSFGEIN